MVISATGGLPSVQMGMCGRWIDFTLNDFDKKEPKSVWKEYYDKLLAFYLRRQMKYDRDAPPAFTGILKVLSTSLGLFRYGLPGGIRDSRFKSPFTIEGLSLCQLSRTLTCSRLTAWKSSISDGPNADCTSIGLPG